MEPQLYSNRASSQSSTPQLLSCHVEHPESGASILLQSSLVPKLHSPAFIALCRTPGVRVEPQLYSNRASSQSSTPQLLSCHVEHPESGASIILQSSLVPKLHSPAFIALCRTPGVRVEPQLYSNRASSQSSTPQLLSCHVEHPESGASIILQSSLIPKAPIPSFYRTVYNTWRVEST